ncbi:3-dehydroquinate synthase II [Desulfococcaceae bacterium HSG7]|nr:3-dehydroquinate synthase II [Desulfococcaceae bacterium HSG9]MDM8554330.1 3-dehydroquinate synthase II [Desulfococcaceae bacterium HSG7]
MRKIWVKADPWDKDLVVAAIEGGADGIMVNRGCSAKVKELGIIKTIAEDGDLILGEDVIYFNIQSSEDEDKIIRLSQNRMVILQSDDWTIIPLENLVAQGVDVIAPVTSLQEARTAFGILEKGVRQILFHTTNIRELKHALTQLRLNDDYIDLKVAEVTDIISVGMGDRVCVDTCTTMLPGQGMLAGNTSNALFLVHSECLSNPYVAPRPFRVNAGAVHGYTRTPGGKTCYLSECGSGDQVLLTDFQGNSIISVVGRVKIEKRPLLMVKAIVDEKNINTILQNAETVRLVTPEGGATSVVNLKAGDRILVAAEDGGRHFGHKIDETIIEK